MSEIADFLPVKTDKPTFYCTVWKDKCKCIKVIESPKFTPRTKHITSKYHYFREFVPNGIFGNHNQPHWYLVANDRQLDQTTGWAQDFIPKKETMSW
jgi:hypothetical protein